MQRKGVQKIFRNRGDEGENGISFTIFYAWTIVEGFEGIRDGFPPFRIPRPVILIYAGVKKIYLR